MNVEGVLKTVVEIQKEPFLLKEIVENLPDRVFFEHDNAETSVCPATLRKRQQ